METKTVSKTTHLRPYDHSLEDNLSMYDHFPYIRNYDLCNEQLIAINSGNVTKFYCYQLGKESFSVPNQDELFMARLESMKQEQRLMEERPSEVEVLDDRITDEQIKELVEDNDPIN